MTAQCQSCSAPSPDAFICKRCQADLRRMLADLPWWIDRLAEAAIGQAKLGDGGRRTSSEPAGLKGDDEVLSKCRCGHPEHALRDECGQPIPTTITVVLDEPDQDGNMTRQERGPDTYCACREYQPAATQTKLRNAFLAAGRVNARAVNMLDKVHNALTTIVRDLCESRGVELPASVAQGGQTPLVACKRLARWLSEHVDVIAGGEDAGHTLTEIRGFVGDARRDGDIGRIVNRPVPMRWLGRCPTWNEDRRSACGFELRCRQDAAEVFCPRCRQVHNPDRLQLLMMNDLERKKLTWDQVLKANRIQPEEYRIPERTLRHWRQPGENGEPAKLKPRGYLRPDGRHVINRHTNEDVPLYLWPDVRRLRAATSDRRVDTPHIWE